MLVRRILRALETLLSLSATNLIIHDCCISRASMSLWNAAPIEVRSSSEQDRTILD